jgi:peptidyl-prolyl cis-trans isomerase SurA
MKFLIKKIILILLLTFNYSNLSAIESVKIVLKINNEILTNIDIENEYNYLIALNNDFKNVEKNKALEIAKDSLMKEKIKKIEVEKYFDLTQKSEILPSIIKSLYAGINIKNLDEFKNYLKVNNIRYSDIEEKINIETSWNNLIYQKYRDQVKINEEDLKKKILLQKSEQNSYLISEILFNTNIEETIEEKYKKIKLSIKNDGFKNSANIYSISESSKLGGKVGWVNESQLSKEIVLKLKQIKTGQYTNPITVPSGNLILRIDDFKKVKNNLDIDKELKKLISFERNKQLNQLSNIFFNKIKNNVLINES